MESQLPTKLRPLKAGHIELIGRSSGVTFDLGQAAYGGAGSMCLESEAVSVGRAGERGGGGALRY